MLTKTRIGRTARKIRGLWDTLNEIVNFWFSNLDKTAVFLAKH